MSRQDQASDTVEPLAYSVEDFARVFGLGRTMAYEEISSGRLVSYKVGRRRFVSARAAVEWQRQLEGAAAGGSAA